jgi:hypothetical protein
METLIELSLIQIHELQSQKKKSKNKPFSISTLVCTNIFHDRLGHGRLTSSYCHNSDFISLHSCFHSFSHLNPIDLPEKLDFFPLFSHASPLSLNLYFSFSHKILISFFAQFFFSTQSKFFIYNMFIFHHQFGQSESLESLE